MIREKNSNIKKIAVRQDARGNDLAIFFQDSMTGCPAMSMFLKTYAELLDRGWAHPNMTWSNKCRMIWAEHQEEVVGGICYEYAQDTRLGWIILSFVDPTWRGQRINELLQNLVEHDLRQSGADRLASLVHVDNHSRQKSAERTGLIPQFYRMNKTL